MNDSYDGEYSYNDVNEDDTGDDNSAFQVDNNEYFENDEITEINENLNSKETDGDDKTAFENKNIEKYEVDYSRPTHWRSGMKDEVWENAKDEQGRVRDPVSGKYMSKSNPWDMGHKPGYEFYKHQNSAKERGISRQEFLDEYYNAEHYRPELPSSNRSHKGENLTDDYFGD